ncbi:pericentriolar material 1 protein-like [Megalops cyprinoides]|uniref:pericentriolar material 1 protein-like n=1 Tax=Megalops cyprinoides TaxID=118141 RepID=UPI0018647A9F|nr:pericentriolar material 1 protein-like [Megalops cyprinoides]
MATGGTPFDHCTDDRDLPNWTASNGSLEDRLNNMDWGVQQKKANRSSEKNKKKCGAAVESRLTNQISPESSPGAGRRRARTPHSFSHVKYATQMSVPDQAELERLRQRINFTDLDERSIGSDSQGRVTAANNQRQLAENKKAFNFLPLHVNTNKGKEPAAAATVATVSPSTSRGPKKQSPGKDAAASPLSKEASEPQRGAGEDGRGEPGIDSSQVVSKLVQIREYIGKASTIRDDLVEKNDIPANVERLSHLIVHLKEQEKSYLKYLQKMLAGENEEDEVRTMDSAVGSESVAESASLNIELRSDGSNAVVSKAGRAPHFSQESSRVSRSRPRIEDNLGRSASQGQGLVWDATEARGLSGLGVWPDRTYSQHPTKGRDGRAGVKEEEEELENLRRQQELLKKMLDQQEQLKALRGRQEALMALHSSGQRAGTGMDDTVITENTGSVSGLSITSELNEELNELIQRFHNQLHDTQTKAVPDNRRQAESLSRGRVPAQPPPPPPPRPQHSATAASARLTKLQELQDKKDTMDKILQELHTLRDHTLNNSSYGGAFCERGADHRGAVTGVSGERCSALNREANGRMGVVTRLDPSTVHHEPQLEDNGNPPDKLRKLKEVHKRLNELRELVQYYEQTSDMMADTVNENVKDEDEETEEGSLFEAMFDSEQETQERVTNIRNPQRAGNWMDTSGLTNAHGSNNRDGRLNTDCEINNRSAANLRSLNIPSAIECQYNRYRPYNEIKDANEEEEEEGEGLVDEEEERERGAGSEASGSSRRSSLGEDPELEQKVRRLQNAKQKLRQLQELVAMVQSDDTDGTTANEEDGLNQQPNNTRASVPKPQRDLSVTEAAREKFYSAKLKQQQRELQRLQEERQRLAEIQGKIQDLQWACPDLQSSVSSAVSQQGPRRIPAAASTPGLGASGAALNPTPEATAATGPDNELWSEMRRHQILREELRQRRKQLESLMAEHHRRTVLSDAPCGKDGAEPPPLHTPVPLSRDERTMATWGGSTPCQLDEDEDGYPSEMGGEEEELEEEEANSSSSEDLAMYPSRKHRSHGGRKLKESCPKWSYPRPADEGARPSSKARSRQRQGARGAGRQENVRRGPDRPSLEGTRRWQEQVNQLQAQLEFSTNMCQTLLQDQQSLSCLLQSLLSSPYSLIPNNVGSPQVHLIMHQLNQCYTQLAWQQNNVQRLKQLLNDLLRQQQPQTPQQSSSQDSAARPASPGLFPPPFTFPPGALSVPGLAGFPIPSGFGFSAPFPPGLGEFTPPAAGPASTPQQQQQADHNSSVRTEYMSFPPAAPQERPPASGADTRTQKEGEGAEQQGGAFRRTLEQGIRSRPFHRESLESLSSLPDPADPTTLTRTFRPGRKASAQDSLASRDKTPNAKRRRSKPRAKNAGQGTDSVSSASEYGRDPAPHSKQREQNRLLDRLTQEKLDSKIKTRQNNELSSACGWSAPLHSNRNACTEAPDTSSDFSLFEALRETIYSEVAALISQNESRPHFLIELFHELQLLNTDYLRQRALYSLQDVVTRHLTERDTADGQPGSLGPVAWVTASNSELTPSEPTSLPTSDADVSEKNMRTRLGLRKKPNNADAVDNESALSVSANFEPFASDDLGDTVIHLDRAAARKREYENMKQRAEGHRSVTAAAELPPGDHAAARQEEGDGSSELARASGDGHCPQIDIEQLDQQIKAIMTEVIPFLKEHMEEVCSLQLLSSVRRMVLSLTQRSDSKGCFRFLHRQLDHILKENLSKFAGRTLKECGEDLLVMISEILFNELAFFSLMQEHGKAAPKHRAAGRADCPAPEQPNAEERKSVEGGESFSAAYSDEDKDKDETEQEPALQDGEASERGGEDRDGGGQPLSGSLSKADSSAVTSGGSGEEERPGDVGTGLADAPTSPQASGAAAHEPEQATSRVSENGCQVSKSSPEPVEHLDAQSEYVEMAEPTEKDEVSCEPGVPSGQSGGDPAAPAETESVCVSREGSAACSPDTDSPVIVNEDEVGSGNLSQKSDEEDFVKVEGLPLQLSALCQEELQKRITKEQQSNDLSAEILNGNVDGLAGLLGNSLTLKEPETVGAQSA